MLIPTDYDPRRPLALTFVYHGNGGTDEDAKKYGLQTAPAAASDSIFVFPRGVQFEGYGVGWNDRCSGYDMPFFDRMVAGLSTDYCIDESRIFAAGFSWGGDHVTALACCRASRVRAVAPSSCTDEFKDAKDYRTYENLPCASAGSVAIRFTFDPGGDRAFPAQIFQSTSALFRSLNRCSSESSPSGGCIAYQGCSAPFLECGTPGINHALPPSWAEDTWRFFMTFKPSPEPSASAAAPSASGPMPSASAPAPPPSVTAPTRRR